MSTGLQCSRGRWPCSAQLTNHITSLCHMMIDPDQSQERLSVGTEVFSHDGSRIDMYGDYLSRLLGNRDSGEGVVEMVRCDEEMIVASLG